MVGCAAARRSEAVSGFWFLVSGRRLPMKRFASLLAVIVLTAGTASAQEVCDVARPLDGQRLLRRLSLDLRGRVPTFDEQTLQAGKAEVSDATVDAFLQSTDFVDVMRGYHANMLWPNIDQVEVDPLLSKLFPIELAPGDVVYFSFLRALYLRSITQMFPPCRNQPAQYDAQGNLVMWPLVVNGQTVAMQEGYVMVAPYW